VAGGFAGRYPTFFSGETGFSGVNRIHLSEDNVEDGEFLSYNKERLVGFEVFTVVYVEILICSRMEPRHLANVCRCWVGACCLVSQR
jgi:hypothetical protein